MASDHDDEPIAPGATFGGYQILERIGRGGMASVWKATHLGLRKHVAIKVLRVEAARARFLQEAEAISRIRHAHVVEVHDLGLVNDIPFLVMELLEGEDLQAFFRRRGALSLTELSDIMVPVCAAVASVHDESVVHRDLKPGNIFLARTRDRGTVPKVLDFGLSRQSDERAGRVHTHASAVMGTPRYMAPEQVRGAREADAASDQYALGVILYRGATGQVPIDDDNPYELLRRVVHGDFLPPRALRPELPEDFEALVLRAMATAPTARFGSVRELGTALLAFASERTRVIHAPGLDPQDPSDPLGEISLGDSTPLGTSALRSQTAEDTTTNVTLGGAPIELPLTQTLPFLSMPRAKLYAAGVLVTVSVVLLWLFTLSASDTTVQPTLTATMPSVAPMPAPPRPPAVPLLIPVVSTLRAIAPPEAPVETLPAVLPVPSAPGPGPTPPSAALRPTNAAPEELSRAAPRRPRTPRGVNAHDID